MIKWLLNFFEHEPPKPWYEIGGYHVVPSNKVLAIAWNRGQTSLIIEINTELGRVSFSTNKDQYLNQHIGTYIFPHE